MEKKLYYDDVALVPRLSKNKSRSTINTGTTICGIDFRLPVIPANMKCVIDSEIAFWLSSNGYFYIMHRFGQDNLSFVEQANKEDWRLISISVGVKASDRDTLKLISQRGLRVDAITIDIAHGHSLLMEDMIKFVKDTLPQTTLIAGINHQK